MLHDKPRQMGAGGLQFTEDGSGPILILIHGVGLRAEAWDAMTPLLSSSFRVLAVDMPGHGASPLQDTDALDGFVDRLSEFVSSQDSPVCLAGHSLGALLALELAANLPEMICGVAALNAVYRRSAHAAQAVQARAVALSRLGQSDPTPTLERWFGKDPQGINACASQACRRWLTMGDPSGYAAAYRVFARSNGPSDETLAKLRQPSLFMTGARDPNSTPGMSEAMAQLVPGGRALILDTAAHMLPMTHARSAAEALIDLFRNNGPNPSNTTHR